MDRIVRPVRLQGRSPAVDFIDERLPQHDPAFANAPSVFDNASGRYLPVLPDQVHQGVAGQSTITGLALRPQTPSGQVAILDQTHQDIEFQSMRFWNDIFAEAMQILLSKAEEPKILTKLGGGIRNVSGWGGICARLNEAQVAYTNEEGTSGVLKRMRRKVADNISQPATHVAKMVPDIDPWTTPVVGTIGLLLQAVATAAKTRQEVLTRLVDLEKTFSNINSFAGTFPKDQEVREVSVHLVVAIFQAVEQAIGFFAKSAGRKAATAVLTGGDYQKDLLNSFDEVQKQSDYLIQKAQNSHFATTRAAILEVLYNQAQAAQKSADAKNEIKDLLEGYARENERDRKDREELRQLVAIQQKQNQELLAILNHSQTIPRPVSPLPVTLALPPPARSYISFPDIQRVKELDGTLSQEDKRKTDRILQTELFRQWMGSLRPAKLLIHGHFRRSKTVSPLSLLTATLTEAAREDQHRFVTLVFFCSCHLDRDEDNFSGGRAIIRALISQLLQQQPRIHILPPPWELNPDRVRQGDLQQLCQLLNLLVHCLPGEVTLLCLIDGMVYYERDEFIGEMQYVLTEIVRLVGDPTVQANVKLLITSPWRTDMAQQFFQEDREILHMEGMPSVELTPSASRVIYRHISHTESGQSSRDNSPSRGDEQQ
ncbi:hypothetical protein LA080_002391 [Diaporthe eres]|nr:hypothetical protein LA080_002391 [Diaporthe eres]